MNIQDNTFFWGDKDGFGIELGSYNASKKKAKLRLWVKSNQIGEFKINHSLKYAISFFEDVITYKENCFDDAFVGKSEAEIFSYCLLMDTLPESRTLDDYSRFQRLKKYSPYLGDQFDSVAIIIYIKNGIFHFIWSSNSNYSARTINYLTNVKHAAIDSKTVKSVCTLFIDNMNRS